MNVTRNTRPTGVSEVMLSLGRYGIGLFLLAVVLPVNKAFPSTLSAKINKLLSNPVVKKAEVGILAVRLNDGAEIFSLNADKVLIPASNMKLLTTACALTRLKPEYSFKTEVYGDSEVVPGKIEGNIYLKGYGDPFLVSEEMWHFVRSLYGLGLREITGDLIVDDSFFDSQRWGKGWGNHRAPRWYNAEISALSFQFNTIFINILGASRPGVPPLVWTDPPQSGFIRLQNRAQTVDKGKRFIQVDRIDTPGKDIFRITGTVPVGSRKKTVYRAVRDATRYTGVSFADYLQREGITIKGRVKSGTVPQNKKLIYTCWSRPLRQIIAGLNRYSNNFIAESILKTMGAELKGIPGTAEKGLEVVRKFLQDAGVKTKSLVLADGSGLSRQNRLSAGALVQLLSYMHERFEYWPEFISSLATYGVDGTLKKRNGGPARFIRAKTGRINGVLALSGYMGKGKNILAFSILMNNIKGNTTAAEAVQDKICRLLGESFTGKKPVGITQ